MHIAEIAMTEPVQQQLLTRNRGLIREGYKHLLQFIKDSAGLLSIQTPQVSHFTESGLKKFKLAAEETLLSWVLTDTHSQNAEVCRLSCNITSHLAAYLNGDLICGRRNKKLRPTAHIR